MENKLKTLKELELPIIKKLKNLSILKFPNSPINTNLLQTLRELENNGLWIEQMGDFQQSNYKRI